MQKQYVMHTARDIKRIFEMSNIQDSPLKFVKRNLNIKRITSLASRGVASLKNEGFKLYILSASYIDLLIEMLKKYGILYINCKYQF